MNEVAAGQVWEAGEALEKAAATLLGRMLFEFARLDVALGLCLVWSGEGRQLEELTKRVSSYSFHKKLNFLEELVHQAFVAGSKKRAAYTEWIELAHTTRLRRNELVHGRWGTDPYQQQVINVFGLPTSSDQSEVRYSLRDLENALEEMKRLQLRLHELRYRWKV